MKAAEHTVTSCTALKQLKWYLEPGSVPQLLREEGYTEWFYSALEICLGTVPCSGLERFQHVAHSSVLWLVPQKILVLGPARKGNYVLFSG